MSLHNFIDMIVYVVIKNVSKQGSIDLAILYVIFRDYLLWQ